MSPTPPAPLKLTPSGSPHPISLLLSVASDPRVALSHSLKILASDSVSLFNTIPVVILGDFNTHTRIPSKPRSVSESKRCSLYRQTSKPQLLGPIKDDFSATCSSLPQRSPGESSLVPCEGPVWLEGSTCQCNWCHFKLTVPAHAPVLPRAAHDCSRLRPPGSRLLLAHSRLPAPQPGSRPYVLFPRDNRINHKTVSAARAHRAIYLPTCIYVRGGGPPSRPRGRRSERRPQPAVLLARVRTRLLPCSSLSFQPRIPPAGPSPRPPAAAGPRGRSGALGILSRSGSRAAGPLPFAPPGKPWSRAPGAAAASPAPRRWGPT